MKQCTVIDQAPPNPSGYCKCGCGGKTPIAKRNKYEMGHVKGHHISYISGHNIGLRPTILRFHASIDVDLETDCWNWIRSYRRDGYGQFRDDDRNQVAHRWSYERFIGPIPKGLQLDHLCRNTGCVNPEHLQPVTPLENTRRGLKARRRDTHCKRGHRLIGDNLYVDKRGWRQCLTCKRASEQKRQARRVAA